MRDPYGSPADTTQTPRHTTRSPHGRLYTTLYRRSNRGLTHSAEGTRSVTIAALTHLLALRLKQSARWVGLALDIVLVAPDPLGSYNTRPTSPLTSGKSKGEQQLQV